MTTITVKLNINPGPDKATVTCEPPEFSANRGNQKMALRGNVWVICGH